MKDHAQAKTELINAAVRVESLWIIRFQYPADFEACLRSLVAAVAEYKQTHQPKRIDEDGDDFDSLHGCG